MFDPCFADVHCPVEFTFSIDVHASTDYVPDMGTFHCGKEISSESAESSFQAESLPKMTFQWSRENAVEFRNAFPEDKLSQLSHRLNIMSLNVTQDNVDEICITLGDIIIHAAKTAGAYKDCRKANGKGSGKNKRLSPPWIDKECVEKRKEYYRMKNLLKIKGAKTVCNKKAKEFKKFMKEKEKIYFKQLNMKIRSLRSSNCNEYWSLLNRSTEGKKTFSALCLQTFMNHFKQLSQKNDPSEPSNPGEETDSAITTAEVNESLSIDSLSETKDIIAKLNNNKACGIDFMINEFLKNAPPPPPPWYFEMYL